MISAMTTRIVVADQAEARFYDRARAGAVLRPAGLLENPAAHPGLAEHVHQLTDSLRQQWAGATRADLNRLPEFAVYRAYYRRFEKTYHVQLQFESVALKGKPLRSNGSLVLAMFAAELQNRLLTAGHDLAAIAGPLTVDLAVDSRRERPMITGWVRPSRRVAFDPFFQASLTWDDLDAIRDIAGLPFMLKGVATSEDAALAVQHGVDVDWVSNHGGRQLDHGLGSLARR